MAVTWMIFCLNCWFHHTTSWLQQQVCFSSSSRLLISLQLWHPVESFYVLLLGQAGKKHFWLLNLTCVLGDFGIIAMFSLEVIVHFHKIKTAIPQSLFSRTIDDVSGNNIKRRYPKYIWNRFSSSLKRGKFKWAKSKGKRKLWQFEQIQVKRLTNDRSVTSGN